MGESPGISQGPTPLPQAAAFFVQVPENSTALSIPQVTGIGLDSQFGKNATSEAGHESLEFQGTRQAL